MTTAILSSMIRIDSSSPLYKLAPRDITPSAQFEVIVSLEGTTPETGATIQTRTSYSPTVGTLEQQHNSH